MKAIAISWFILTAAALAQSQPNVSASTTGKCSVANAGNKNTFTINCGVDKRQGEKIIALLNKVLAGQLDSDAMMQKLDSCIVQVAPRSIARELRPTLIDALKQQPGRPAYKLELYLYNGTSESLRYALQIQNAFETAGWSVTATPMLGRILPDGMAVLVRADTSAPGIAVQQA